MAADLPLLCRTLFVSRTFPLDFEHSTHGIFQRMQMLLRSIAGVSRAVDALFFVPASVLPGIDVRRYERLISEGWGVDLRLRLAPMAQDDRSWSAFYLSPIFDARHHEDNVSTSGDAQSRAVAEAIEDDVDLVVAHRLQAAMPVQAAARFKRLPPVVVDVDDIQHRKYFRELCQPPHWMGKILRFLQVPAIATAECRSVRNAAMSLVCSQVDLNYLTRISASQRITVVPNSVDLTQVAASPAVAATQRIVYVGTFSHRPNVDAAEYLLREVFPIVRMAVPTAQLELVGPRIEVLPSYGKVIPGVRFRGYVDDLGTVWRDARLLCCAIRAGGGTRIKIIEAAARGVPVVSTTMGAEGLDFEDGRDILLRDSPAALAQACVRVLCDDELAASLATSARVKALRYDRNVVIHDLAGVLMRAARGRAHS